VLDLCTSGYGCHAISVFFFGNPKVNYPVNTIPTLDRSVKQLNLVRFVYSVALF